MKAIRKNVGVAAEVIDVNVNYDFMSKTVGGYIQMVPIGPNVEIVCNEEGMFAGPGGTPLPFNAAGYLGNILIIGFRPCLSSLTPRYSKSLELVAIGNLVRQISLPLLNYQIDKHSFHQDQTEELSTQYHEKGGQQ